MSVSKCCILRDMKFNWKRDRFPNLRMVQSFNQLRILNAFFSWTLVPNGTYDHAN